MPRGRSRRRESPPCLERGREGGLSNRAGLHVPPPSSPSPHYDRGEAAVAEYFFLSGRYTCHIGRGRMQPRPEAAHARGERVEGKGSIAERLSHKMTTTFC